MVQKGSDMPETQLKWFDLFDAPPAPSPPQQPTVEAQEMADLPEPQADEQGVDFDIQAEELKSDYDATLSESADIPLYDFQEESVKLMTQVVPPSARNFICLLCDEQGMGKTRQLIAAAVELDAFPAVSFAPANLVGKWADDFAELAPQLTTKIAADLAEDGWWEGADVILISYSNVTPLADIILPPDDFFKLFMGDETHYLKNGKARRTKIAYLIRLSCLNAACFLASGTPLYSRPSDLITQIELLGQLKWFGGAKRFKRAFVTSRYGVERARNTTVLHNMLKKYCNMIRRTKDGRLTQKTRHLIPVTPSQPVFEKYRQLEGVARMLRDNKEMYLGAVMQMRKHLSISKLDVITEWIERFFRENPGESLLAFGVFVETVEELARRFPNAAVYYGKTPKKKKEAIRKDFQAGKYRLFIGNITAAGVGLDLYHASDVVFFDLPWTAAELFQAEDRVHRFGQTKPVEVHIPFFEQTRDERNIKAIVSRAKDARLVIDGKQDWSARSFIEGSRASVEFGSDPAA